MNSIAKPETAYLTGYDPDSWTYDFFEKESGRWIGYLSSDEINALGTNRTPATIVGASCKEEREEGLTLERYRDLLKTVEIFDLQKLCFT